MSKIYTKYTNKILFEDTLLNFKELVEEHKKNLKGAKLCDADLGCANLSDADLGCANLRGANLSCADLKGANLNDATIRSHKEISAIGGNKILLKCFLLSNDSFYFMAGCFSGTEQELKEKVIYKYGVDCEYIEAIEFLKNLCLKYNGE